MDIISLQYINGECTPIRLLLRDSYIKLFLQDYIFWIFFLNQRKILEFYCVIKTKAIRKKTRAEKYSLLDDVDELIHLLFLFIFGQELCHPYECAVELPAPSSQSLHQVAVDARCMRVPSRQAVCF